MNVVCLLGFFLSKHDVSLWPLNILEVNKDKKSKGRWSYSVCSCQVGFTRGGAFRSFLYFVDAHTYYEKKLYAEVFFLFFFL